MGVPTLGVGRRSERADVRRGPTLGVVRRWGCADVGGGPTLGVGRRWGWADVGDGPSFREGRRWGWADVRRGPTLGVCRRSERADVGGGPKFGEGQSKFVFFINRLIKRYFSPGTACVSFLKKGMITTIESNCFVVLTTVNAAYVFYFFNKI